MRLTMQYLTHLTAMMSCHSKTGGTSPVFYDIEKVGKMLCLDMQIAALSPNTAQAKTGSLFMKLENVCRGNITTVNKGNSRIWVLGHTYTEENISEDPEVTIYVLVKTPGMGCRAKFIKELALGLPSENIFVQEIIYRNKEDLILGERRKQV